MAANSNNKSILSIFDAILKEDISPNDQQLLKSIINVCHVESPNLRFQIAVRSFLDEWKRCIATNGRRCGLFLFRNEELSVRWASVWSTIENELQDVHYGGISSIADHVLALILRSSTSELLVTVSKVDSVSTFDNIANEFGVYGSDDFDGAASSSIAIPDCGASQSAGISSSIIAENVRDAIETLPNVSPILIDRYRDQAAYLVVRGRELFRNDQRRMNFINGMIELLATCEFDQAGWEKIDPSDELIQILYVVDRRALELSAGSTGLESIISSLKSDRVLSSMVGAIMNNVADGLAEGPIISSLLEFIIDTTERSIWNIVEQRNRQKEKGGTTMSFRTAVLSEASRKRK